LENQLALAQVKIEELSKDKESFEKEIPDNTALAANFDELKMAHMKQFKELCSSFKKRLTPADGEL
jgi:hypothetical protein